MAYNEAPRPMAYFEVFPRERNFFPERLLRIAWIAVEKEARQWTYGQASGHQTATEIA